MSEAGAKKLKRVPLKEELVALTSCFVKALILQQFIYWSERTRDVDAYLAEEKLRDPTMKIDPIHGWIYKATKKLHGELMFGNTVSPATVGRRTKELIAEGWLRVRHNPKVKWDRKLQYRVDILKIQVDLRELGYALEGYPLPIEETAFFTLQNASGAVENPNGSGAKALVESTIETTSEIKEKEEPQPPAPEPAPASSDLGSELGPAPKSKPRRKSKTPVKRPAAVHTYRAIFCLFPAKTTWPALNEAIGDDPAKLDKWKVVCKAWNMQQNNPKNLTGLLDWFKDGIPDYAKPGGPTNGNSAKANGTGNHQADDKEDQRIAAKVARLSF